VVESEYPPEIREDMKSVAIKKLDGAQLDAFVIMPRTAGSSASASDNSAAADFDFFK